MQKIARATIEDQNKLQARRATFNWKDLSDDVKFDLKNCAAKKPIARSDIFKLFHAKWKLKTYCNKFTREATATPGIPGTQHSMLIIEYPDAPYTASGGVVTK